MNDLFGILGKYLPGPCAWQGTGQWDWFAGQLCLELTCPNVLPLTKSSQIRSFPAFVYQIPVSM